MENSLWLWRYTLTPSKSAIFNARRYLIHVLPFTAHTYSPSIMWFANSHQGYLSCVTAQPHVTVAVVLTALFTFQLATASLLDLVPTSATRLPASALARR